MSRYVSDLLKSCCSPRIIGFTMPLSLPLPARSMSNFPELCTHTHAHTHTHTHTHTPIWLGLISSTAVRTISSHSKLPTPPAPSTSEGSKGRLDHEDIHSVF